MDGCSLSFGAQGPLRSLGEGAAFSSSGCSEAEHCPAVPTHDLAASLRPPDQRRRLSACNYRPNPACGAQCGCGVGSAGAEDELIGTYHFPVLVGVMDNSSSAPVAQEPGPQLSHAPALFTAQFQQNQIEKGAERPGVCGGGWDRAKTRPAAIQLYGPRRALLDPNIRAACDIPGVEVASCPGLVLVSTELIGNQPGSRTP